MKYIDTEKVIIKSWCDNPEDGCIAQAKNLANLPFVFKQVCLMPDTHQGYGMPIGGVIATNGVIIPNAVGVDIGCGMGAVQTTMTAISQDELKAIMGKIRDIVPVGFNHQKEQQDKSLMPDDNLIKTVVTQQYSSARYQLGTLGGGNHFIEIQKGSDGHIWFMIHSGSRNLGKQVADYYNKLAVSLNEKWFSSVPKEHELAFLPIETQEAKDYMAEMNYCLEFAKANRALMIENIKKCFIDVLHCSFLQEINIHHNYAKYEHHFGKNVIIHRKGATSARENEIGLIPGSQGTASYVVKGKGNLDSFMSCSHGAGRRMGRKQAIRELSLEEEQKKLEGIIHSVRNKEDLEEASGAYKDIKTVMEEQKDLVDIVVELKPLGVIKG